MRSPRSWRRLGRGRGLAVRRPPGLLVSRDSGGPRAPPWTSRGALPHLARGVPMSKRAGGCRRHPARAVRPARRRAARRRERPRRGEGAGRDDLRPALERAQGRVPGVGDRHGEQCLGREDGRGAAGHPVDAATSRLVVFASFGTPRLAWQVTTTGIRPSQTPSRLKTWVDARSGAVVDSAETIAEGTGNTMYSGTVTLATTGTKDTSGMYPPAGLPSVTTRQTSKERRPALAPRSPAPMTRGATAPRQDVRPLVPTPSGGAGDVRLPPRGVRPSGDLEQRCRGTQPGALRQRVRPGEAG